MSKKKQVRVKVLLPPAVACYCYLDEPDTFKGQTKYKAELIFEDPTAAEQAKKIINKAIDQVLEKQGDSRGDVFLTGIKDGNKKKKPDEGEDDKYARYRGNIYIGATSGADYMPGQVDAKKQPIPVGHPDRISFGGDKVRAIVSVGCGNVAGVDRAFFRLEALQLIEKGSGGFAPSTDMFDEEDGYTVSADVDDIEDDEVPF